MKKKQLIALLMAVMLLLLSACAQVKPGNTTTPTNTNTNTNESGSTTNEPVKLKLIYQSSYENIANVMRDQLTKAGFVIELSACADGATFRDAEKNGNFDIALASWANPVGTPDYGCRGIWQSTSDSNLLGVNDAKLDELVIKAAAQTADQYVKTYGEAEKYVVEEMCYMSPIYCARTGRGYTKLLVDDSVTPNQRWEFLKYVDKANTDSRTLVLAQTGTNFSTWDCIRVDDQASGYALDEMYIHLVTLQPDWSVSVDQSLSYSYAISEDNTGYYFLLRDDCGFARIDKDGKVYDSGVKVAGEDVVYSLNRAKDPNSTPMHATYSMFASLEKIEIIEDIAELENTKTGSGKNVREVLEEAKKIDELVTDRKDVDNAGGKYQVVKCTTSVPYPQILNALTFHGAGIVDSEWVENMNKDVDVSKYDATKDKLYGDSVTTVEGASFDNQLSLSGNYVLTSMNDYQINFVANPYIRTNEDNSSIIKNITLKLIADKDTILSSLRSGDVDYPYTLPETKYELVEQDSKLGITYFPGIRAFMVGYNLHGNSVVSNSVELRKAIASCIKFDDYKAVLNGNALEIYSPLSTCLDCGNKLVYNEGDTAKYLQAYYDSLKK